MIETLVLVSAVPGDVASGIGGVVVLAGGAMWRRIIALEQQSRIDNQAHWESTAEMYHAAMQKTQSELDYYRKKDRT